MENSRPGPNLFSRGSPIVGVVGDKILLQRLPIDAFEI